MNYITIIFTVLFFLIFYGLKKAPDSTNVVQTCELRHSTITHCGLCGKCSNKQDYNAIVSGGPMTHACKNCWLEKMDCINKCFFGNCVKCEDTFIKCAGMTLETLRCSAINT